MTFLLDFPFDVYCFEQLVVGIASMVDLILYAITVGKLKLAVRAPYYIYRSQNYKHNSNFTPKTVANLIKPKVWPL